jgi:hypothetical protein
MARNSEPGILDRLLGPGFSTRIFLLSNPEPLDQIRVAVRVLPLEVVEETPALADELQQATARMMILGVGLEMFGQVVDPLAEEGDLNLW